MSGSTASDKACNIAKNPKYDGYPRGLASLVYNFFVKKSSGDPVKSQLCQTKISWRITQTNYQKNW